ncbi:pyroglutamyl-peptidase 1-like protein isoform X2 [Oryx dammah]|uniref:pyroglutamyl-peptidase 1-like protein isoform X2 n=1 Tax=Oryx dammah TaxID=59534 RepID=UPI001A9B5446|nr:pyroglutamyl-peptidase 1-like protein isoform X2 [Oryx dammah]
MDSRSSCVVVTGFGPFRQHLVNSSWEAVKELSKLGLGSDMEVELQTLQLPVDYREVKQRVARIWEDLQPQFVAHVGVDPAAKAIFLEQCGKNRGYRDADIRGFRPECGVCLPDGPEVIASEVSMKAVSRRAAVQGVEVAFSRDAGRLCHPVPSRWVLGAAQSHHADPHVAHFCLGLILRTRPLTSLWWLAEEKGWVCLRLRLLPVFASWKWVCGPHPCPSVISLAARQPAGKSPASPHPGNAGGD